MKKQFIIAAAVLAAAGATQASVTNYWGGDITNTTTWLASEAHSMTGRVTILPGATLIIEPGTVVQSTVDGTLAITAGAQIFAKGTAEDPITFTSTNDDFSTWQAQANQWGSIAVMGEGIISTYRYKDGVRNGTTSDVATALPNAVGTHTTAMEGLVAVGDGREIYGGNNDDYDAGTLSYLSLRYAGQGIEEGDELNGLSLGGIGRETQIDHIEIMNNVDDGIEIWGGTVCLKYISIWNIGDDSLDCDQGWRGKVQHGLIVQGYSVNDEQGSGIGDNCIEMDGSEDSDCEPHTSSVLYNMTVIGNVEEGDHGMALRDNVRLQVRNSLFIDCIGDVFLDEELDGDGGSGWNLTPGVPTSPSNGKGGTWASRDYVKVVPDMEETYNVPFNAGGSYSNYVGDTVRLTAAGKTAADVYWAQADGYMNEISDTVFYNCDLSSHFATIVASNYPGISDYVDALSLPIANLERGPIVPGLAKDVAPVTNLNPLAVGDAVSAVSLPTNDGFFDQVSYRGAFSANYNWLWEDSAAVQYGFMDLSVNTNAIEFGLSGVDTGITFSFPSELGVTYSVRRSATVDGTYTEVGTVVGTGTDLDYIDTTTGAAAFYKVVAL